MTSYKVQFVLPVDNPVSNVSQCRGKGYHEFLVPINHPNAHTMGYQELLGAAQLSGLFHLRTGVNKTGLKESKTVVRPKPGQPIPEYVGQRVLTKQPKAS